VKNEAETKHVFPKTVSMTIDGQYLSSKWTKQSILCSLFG